MRACWLIKGGGGVEGLIIRGGRERVGPSWGEGGVVGLIIRGGRERISQS